MHFCPNHNHLWSYSLYITTTLSSTTSSTAKFSKWLLLLRICLKTTHIRQFDGIFMQINSTQKNGKSSFVVGICGGTRSTLPPTAIRPPSKMILNQKQDFTKKNWKIALGCTQLHLAASRCSVVKSWGKKVGHVCFRTDLVLLSYLPTTSISITSPF